MQPPRTACTTTHCGILPKKVPRGSRFLGHVDGPLQHVTSLIPPGRESLIPPGYLIFGILSDQRSTLIRMSHSRHSVRPTSHLLRMSHSRNSIRLMFHLLRVSHIRRLSSDGRGGRFNFPGQTCLDPLVTPIQSARLTYPRSPHLAPGV